MNLNYNYKPKLSKLRNLLNICKQRKLLIKGKITIINTLALSPLIYTSNMIETPPDNDNDNDNGNILFDHNIQIYITDLQ